MAVAPGTRVGVFEIAAQIGAGGMGEVYRATDTNLKRQVAIKILPASLAGDADRLARFQREAEVLAALNHPNIAAIYGLEKTPDFTALVMELVEGDDLSQRIAKGAIPIDEALPIAKQIADALEAAHEQGIIHRDLKPANIKVRSDGTAKVLDFGLAKAMEPPAGSSTSMSMSPTLTTPAMTQAGVILGTAAYMSPEQAAGKSADKRSDLWSFGVVLLEMLTGARVFTGETVAHVLAAVLRAEPDWATLPSDTPASVRRLLRRCLEKDRKRRLDSAAVAGLELEEARTSPVSETRRVQAPRRVLPIALAAMISGALAAAVASRALTRPAPPAVAGQTRFVIQPSAALAFAKTGQYAEHDFAVAPDGSFLVYLSGEQRTLVVRWFDRLDPTPLEGVTGAAMPFVSPDSRWIGFVRDDFTIRKVPVSGGAPVTLARLPVWPRGASWVDDQTIIIGTNSPTTGLLRVPAGGGEPTVLTTPDREHGEEGHVLPSGLPGGQAVLFTIGAAEPGNAQIALLDLRTGRRTTLLRGGRDAQYVASGHIVYMSGLALSAVRFDLARQVVVGDPARVMDRVAATPTSALDVAVTNAGTLVFVPGGTATVERRSLAWADRQGRETPIAAPRRPYGSARLSPDGTRVAVNIRDQENDIWTWDLTRQTLARLTFDADRDFAPVWTPDSSRVVFASSRAGGINLYARDVNGSTADVRLTTSANTQVPDSVTPDGAFVITHEVRPTTDSDILRYSLSLNHATAAGNGEDLVVTPFQEWNGEVSPDGRFLAYQSGESGEAQEVYVRPYPAVASVRWQVSSGGGDQPVWTRGGRELIYVDREQRLTSVPVDPGVTFRAGTAERLSVKVDGGAGSPWRQYDVTADGMRFLVLRDSADSVKNAVSSSFVVVLNWQEELKRLVPTR